MSHFVLSRQAFYGFPHQVAARIAVITVGSHLAEKQLPELVIFVER
jgi:hypothetical protein